MDDLKEYAIKRDEAIVESIRTDSVQINEENDNQPIAVIKVADLLEKEVKTPSCLTNPERQAELLERYQEE